MGGERRHDGVVGAATAAVSIAAMEIGVAVSLAAFVFSGDLAAGLPRATVSFLLGAAAVLGAVGSFTSLRVAVASAQDTPAVIAAAIGGALATTVAPDQLVSTMFVTLALAAGLAALLFFAVGQARLGELVRSIPFTVISGFMAGTGWLLFWGGVSVMTNSDAGLGSLGALLTSDLARFWVPGLALAAFIVVILERTGSAAVTGFSILLVTAAVHGVGRIGWSGQAIEENGWLLGPFESGAAFSPMTPNDFADADWGAIAGQALPLASLAAISLVAVLLNLSGLEVACEEDIDLDVELKAAGAGNVIIAAMGGLVGYHMMGLTVITQKMRVRGRLVPLLVVGLMVLGAFIGGPQLAGLFPRPVVGAVLASSGISLAYSWLKQLNTFSRIDVVLSTLVLLGIIAFGVLTGIVIGVLAAVVVFVYNYGRISPVRNVHRMSSIESNIDRPTTHRALLLKHDDEVAVLELQGYLFFGSVRSVAERVSDLIDDSLRYLILDFRGVRGVDASVLSGLLGVERRAASSGVRVVWTHVRDEIAQQLESVVGGDRHFEDDVDRALEWVEGEILASEGDLLDAVIDIEWIDAVAAFGVRMQLEPDEVLVDVSDQSGRVFVVESGTLSAWGEASSGAPIRYRQVGPGSLLGEIAFTTGAARSASVIADTAAVVVGIDRAEMERMVEDAPALARQTEHVIAVRLAERLSATSRIVRNLSG